MKDDLFMSAVSDLNDFMKNGQAIFLRLKYVNSDARTRTTYERVVDEVIDWLMSIDTPEDLFVRERSENNHFLSCDNGAMWDLDLVELYFDETLKCFVD